jgi:hypothetical protein
VTFYLRYKQKGFFFVVRSFDLTKYLAVNPSGRKS